MPEEELFVFSGLWDSWTNRGSGEILNTFTIITSQANPLVAKVHDRMPVILEPEDELKYLGSTITEQEIMELLKPYPESQMKTYQVSNLVNSPKNDSPELIEPVKI